MNVNDKINFKANACFYLEFNQYLQLVELNKLALAPYYRDRLIKQSRVVEDNENFKSVFGMYRFKYENRN